jgi:D-aminoacyl-tRNA deacylase
MIALSKRSERVPAYEITVEATHHGPTSLSKPVLFVEIGSTSKQWGDERAAEVVGDALVDALTKTTIWDKVAIGFGGTHYPQKIKEAVIEGEFAVSFVAPKYVLEYVDEAMIGQMIQKTMGPVRYALVDWKGLGPHKDRLMGAISRFGLEVVRL